MDRSPPPPPPLSKQDEFARHGFREGYPLWNPDPVLLPQGRQNKGLEIGDIGTIDEDGSFYIVLNLFHSPDPALGGQPNIYVSETFETGYVFSSPETSWRIEERGASYYTSPHIANHGRIITQYISPLSEDGAHVIVPQGAKCFKLEPRDKSDLEGMAADPSLRATWFDLANNRLGSRTRTLYLITGLCQTRSWSLASFNRKNDQEVRVCCELVEEDGKLQVGRAASHWTPRGRFSYKIGPSIERQGDNNQTIFIQSFAITHKDNVQPLRLRQLTTAVTRAIGRGSTVVQPTISNHGTNNSRPGPSNQHIGRSEHVNSVAMMLATESAATVIQHIPITSPAFHPSEIINQYLLAKVPFASAAVTHDSLWMTMLADGQLSKLQGLETILDALVTEHYLIVSCNGVVYLKNNLLSLRRFGIESPVDLTDCVKQGNEVISSRHIFGDIHQSILRMSRQTIKVATMIIKKGQVTPDSDLHAMKQKQARRMITDWSKLDHTNVLPLIWTLEAHDRLSVVFPWTENGTLTSYLDTMHRKLTEVQTLTLINDVASGLQYLHSKGILHSGLSSSIVVVDEHETALLSVFGYMTPLDGGIAPLFARLDRETDFVRWAAPESLGLWIESHSLTGVLTRQSNVYSLGGIMLQILSGMVPYHYFNAEADVVSAIHNKSSPQRPDDPHLTDCRWDFIKRCWLPSEFRPSMTEVLEFCKRELFNAMSVADSGLTPPTGIQSVSSGGLPLGHQPPVAPSVGADHAYPPLSPTSMSTTTEYPHPPFEIDTGGDVRAVIFTANNEYLVGGGAAGVRVWRLKDGEQVATLPVKVALRCVAVSNDDGFIAAGSNDGDVFVWDATNCEQVFAGKLGTSIIFNIDFSPVYSSRLVSAANTATVLNIAAHQKVQVLDHGGLIYAAKYSAQGDRIATATRESVRLWDSDDGRLLVDIEVELKPSIDLLWFNSHLFIKTYSKIKKIDATPGSTTVSEWSVHDDPYSSSCIALPQHGKFIAHSTTNTVAFWDTETHTQFSPLQFTHDISSIACSSDGQLLAIAEERKIIIEVISSVVFPSLSEPDLNIPSTALNAWKVGRLTHAEASLSDAAPTSLVAAHYILASRALIRARLGHWSAALVDAEESIKAQRSVIGYIAMCVARVGNGETDEGCQVCDIASLRYPSEHGLFLLIKAIVLFMAGEHVNAISRMDGLVSDVWVDPALFLVQAYMHLLLGNQYTENRDYVRAIQSFKNAQVKLGNHTHTPPLIVSLISGWSFDGLAITIQQRLEETDECVLRRADQDISIPEPTKPWVSGGSPTLSRPDVSPDVPSQHFSFPKTSARIPRIAETASFKFNHTMLRVKDPKASLKFYCDILGMDLLSEQHMTDFSLYFLGYDHTNGLTPEQKAKSQFDREGVLELTHNHGTESDPTFHYASGNAEPGRGFGHIAIAVDNIEEACERFERLGVSFKKRLTEGRMKTIAFLLDPDGYWVEIVPRVLDL